MKIDRSNYESFFMDYLEGNLPDDKVMEIRNFLKNNPDLNSELEAISKFRLMHEQVSFPDKKTLYKNEEEEINQFENNCIAYYEGDLSESETRAFLQNIKNDKSKEASFRLMQKIHLEPETAIVYPDKNQLKKKNKPVVYWWISGAAAVLLIALTLNVLLKNVQEPNPIIISEVPEENTMDTSPNEEEMAQLPSKEEGGAELNTRQEELALLPKQEIGHIDIQKDKLEVSKSRAFEPTFTRLSSKKELLEKPIANNLALVIPKNENNEYLTVDEYLAMKLINAPKGETFSLNNVVKAGINAAEKISNNKLNIEKNDDGKVSEINFESWILAFSIPTKNK